MPDPCSHFEFESHVEVTRMTDQAYGPVMGYTAVVRVKCAECKLPFLFKGLPGGFSFERPMTGTIPYEARMPIEPVPLDERADVEVAIELADKARQDYFDKRDPT